MKTDIIIKLIRISGSTSDSTSGHTHNHIYNELNLDKYKLLPMILVNNVDNTLESTLISLGYTTTNLNLLKLYNFIPIPRNLVNPYSIIILSRNHMDTVYKPIIELLKNKK
jgi:hypothetical protein